MKRSPTVESVITKVKFPQSRLEKYFNNSNLNDNQLKHRMSKDFEMIACRSVHATAKGHVQVVFAQNSALVSVDIPTSAHFIVTGVKTYKQPYRIGFVVSLS